MKTWNVVFFHRAYPKWKSLSLSLTLSAGPVFSGGIRLIWWGCDWSVGRWAKLIGER